MISVRRFWIDRTGEKIFLNGSEDECLTEEEAGKHTAGMLGRKTCKTLMPSECKELHNRTKELHYVSKKINIAEKEHPFP